jgi:hypothetical protein
MSILSMQTIDSFKKHEPFSYAPTTGNLNGVFEHTFIRTYLDKEVLCVKCHVSSLTDTGS